MQARQIFTTGSEGRLARTILRAGAALVDRSGPESLRVAAIPVLGPDGTVVLVEERLGHELQKALPRIERLGFRAIVSSPVPVDVDRGRVRVPDVATLWKVDRAAFDRQFPLEPGDDDLQAIDAPVTRVVVATAALPDTDAARVVAATGLVRSADGGLQVGAVAGLARLLERAELAPYVLDDPRPLRGLITSRSSTSGTRS